MSASRWFSSWFGEWFSGWFGAGAEAPVPPVVIAAGHSPEVLEKKRKRLHLAVLAGQKHQAGATALQLEAILAIYSQQAPGQASTAVDSERSAVVLPSLTRQKPGEVRLGRTIDTIGEYIPRPRPPQLHPSPRAATRPQRQDARRPRKAVHTRTHDDEEAIVKAIASLL